MPELASAVRVEIPILVDNARTSLGWRAVGALAAAFGEAVVQPCAVGKKCQP